MKYEQIDLFADCPMKEVSQNIIGASVINAISSHKKDVATDLSERKTIFKPNKKRISNKIEDFGEKIGGARKDIFQMYRSMLKKEDYDNIKSQPLSKIWPAPDYEKLLKAGMDENKVAMIRALREAIGNKPRKGSWKLSMYCKKVSVFRSIAIDILDDKVNLEGFNDLQSFYDRIDIGKRVSSDMSENWLENFKEIYGLQIYGSYLLYKANGHKQSFKDFKLSRFGYGDGISYGFTGKGHWWEPDSEVNELKDIPKSVNAIIKKYGNQEENKTTNKKEKGAHDYYKIYRAYNSDKGQYDYMIGRKYGSRVFYYPQKFEPTAKKLEIVYKYIDDHVEELDSYFEKLRKIPSVRSDYNEERTGVNARTQDVTPEDFLSTFGFRGVEFGNYVEGKRRQDDLNQAYDALMDLSKVLNIPTQAVSLGGRLGLAFGARGRGGKHAAMAHYEPDYEVINLTKKSGAGSLAHEWFHALDHSLAQYHNFRSDAVTKTILNMDDTTMDRVNPDLSSNFFEYVRQFSSVINLHSRSKDLDQFSSRSDGYWESIEEMGARTFEALIKRKLSKLDIRNDFLVNVKSKMDWEVEANPEQPYPYPTEEELDTLEPYFDKFVSSIKQEENEEGKICLYSSRGDGKNLEENSKQISYNELTPEETAIHAFGEQILDVQTVFLDADEKLHGKYDKDANIMYLNRNSEVSLPWVVMHETFHAMKNADPDLYNEIMAFTNNEEAFSKEVIDAYRKERNDMSLSEEIVKEELLADAFADYKTGRRVMKNLSEKQPTTASKLCKFFNDVVSGAKKFFFGEDKKVCEEKYPQAKLSNESFDAFAKHIENLHKEHLETQKLTKGEEMFMLTMNEADNIDNIISPYAYNPTKQAEFDFKFIANTKSKYKLKDIACVVDSVSPLGKDGYTSKLLNQVARKSNLSKQTR